MGGSATFEGFAPNPAQVLAIVVEEATGSLQTATHLTLTEILMRMQRHRRTGHMMRGTTSHVEHVGNLLIGIIGNNVFYTPYLERGTGLYGPLNHWIYPKKAKALRFPQPGNKGFTLAGRQRSGKAGSGAIWAYAKRVRGVRPMRFFRDAALVTRVPVERELQAGAMRAAERIALSMRRKIA